MAGTWDLLAKATNTNLGYSYFPSVWEDSGKVYVRAQGEYDINVYDIATDVWSTLVTMDNTWGLSTSALYGLYTEFVAIRHELLWVYDTYIYLFVSSRSADTAHQHSCIIKINKTTGARISATDLYTQNGTLFPELDGYHHGDWGRNRHKAAVKDQFSGRIFIVNFYVKKIYEFNTSNDTFSLVKTWTETVGGVSANDVSGCDAVCINGKIYIMGKHSYAANSGGIAGPLEIDIATWNASTKAAYPDYGAIANQTYNHYCDSQWFDIGNLIYGIGGRMQSTANADGSGTSESAGNILRQVSFDTINNVWADLGIIDQSYLYASTCSSNATGLVFGGYINGSASQLTNQFTFLPTAVSGVSVVYDYSTKTLTFNWAYEDTSPSAFQIDYKKQADTSWSTEYAWDAIGGEVRTIAVSYLAAACGGDNCYSITYTYADTSTETVTAATSNFLLTSTDLESNKYLFRITPIVVL